MIEIIIKKSLLRIKENFIGAKLSTYSLGYNHSDSSEELLWRSMIFNRVLYLVRTKNIKYDRSAFFQVFNKERKKERKTG